jgi:hypothetical protein
MLDFAPSESRERQPAHREAAERTATHRRMRGPGRPRFPIGSGLLVVTLLARPADAQSGSDARAIPVLTRAVAAFPDGSPTLTPVGRFDDVEPASPPDPAVRLLAENPYDSALVQARAAENLGLAEPSLENPYSDALRFENPYSDALRFENPYSDALRAAGPGPELDRFENPYSELAGARARR